MNLNAEIAALRTPPDDRRAPIVPVVMVVDDDASVRTMLGVALERRGFSVLSAFDGVDAIEVFTRRHESVDAVLMDVCMPRLDGPKTLTALLQIAPGIKCCFMSGGLGGYSESDLVDHGAAHFLRKPFDVDEAAAVMRGFAVDRLAGRGRPTDGAN